MKRLKRIIAVLLIIVLFISSFAGSYSYFSNGTFRFDTEKLAIFSEDENCYFLREAANNIKFQIELSEKHKKVAYSLTDSSGGKLNFNVERAYGKIYNIVPPKEGYVEGEQYTLTLGEGISFTEENLKKARTLIFTIERNKAEEYKFNKNVIKTDSVITKKQNGYISFKEGKIKAGDILFGKDEEGKYVVYKILDLKNDGTALVNVPAIDEIYEDLNIYGEYEFNVKEIMDNPELDIETVENIKKSDFFSNLVMTAYAAEDYDKTKISVSKTPDFDNNSIEIKIVITLKAGKNGLFGIEQLRDHSVSLTLKVKKGLRVNANIQGIKNWDVSGTIETKTAWNVEIKREKNTDIVDKEIGELFSDKTEYRSYNEYYRYKQYQNNIKKITNKLNEMVADANSGEIKLFDWNLPVPSVPGLHFSAEVKLFVDFSVAASAVIGQENYTVYTVGVCYINKKFNSYYNTYKSGEDVSLSLRGKMKLKAGVKLSVAAVLICDEVACIELDPQVGLYSEFFATLPILGEDVTEKQLMYSYFEPGVYFEAEIKAKLNLMVRKFEFSEELVEKKFPVKEWTLGNNKIATGLVVNGTTVRAINNKAKLPEIFFEYYDVKTGINSTKKINHDNLKFVSNEGAILKVDEKDDKLILPSATSSGSCYVTVSYLHTDGKTYSSVFRVLISGSMIEGKVSAYQENLEAASLEGAEVLLYSMTNTSTPISKQSTDENGRFAFNVSKGEYQMIIRADGYQTLKSIQKVEDDEIKYAEHILLIDNEQGGIGSAGGTLSDAINGRGVSGAKLKLRTDWNNKMGQYVEGVELETDSSGKYYFENIPVGYYTVEASLHGYVMGYTNIIVLNNPKKDFDFTITPLLAEDEIRIVLTWGDKPSDLDSHLIGRTPNEDAFNVYYMNKRYTFNGVEMANLDVDDTTSYGPETITILEEIDGTYTYAVHDFTNKGSNESTALSLSGALVRVFVGSEQIREYHVPTDQVGTYWTVFEISGSGRIVPINSVSNIKPAA